MQPEESGPTVVVLYPPIDNEDNNEGVGQLSSNRRAKSNSSVCASGSVEDRVTTTTAVAAANNKNGESDSSNDSSSNSNKNNHRWDGVVMSKELADKFEQLKRRKKCPSGRETIVSKAARSRGDEQGNDDNVDKDDNNIDDDSGTGLAEETLGMAVNEIARMHRACAELELRLLAPDHGGGGGGGYGAAAATELLEAVANPCGVDQAVAAGGEEMLGVLPRGAGSDDDGYYDEFPRNVLVPRVVMISASRSEGSSGSGCGCDQPDDSTDRDGSEKDL